MTEEQVQGLVTGFHQEIISDINRNAKSQDEADKLYRSYVQTTIMTLALQSIYTEESTNAKDFMKEIIDPMCKKTERILDILYKEFNRIP